MTATSTPQQRATHNRALTWQARADREAELIAATAYGPTHFEAMAS